MDAPHEDEEENQGLKQSFQKLKERFLPRLEFTLVISLVINFAMVVVGCLNLNNCPLNKKIPIILISIGLIGILSKLCTILRKKITFIDLNYVIKILYAAEIIALVCGAIWVYIVFKPSYNDKDKLYCNKTTYMFAFIYITICISFLIAILLGYFCFAGVFILMGVNEKRKNDVENGGQSSGENQGPTTYLRTNET